MADANEAVTIDHADEEIGAAWRDILAKQAPEEAAEIEAVAAESEPKTERVRDQAGKFAKAEAVNPTDAPAEPATEPTATPEAQAAQPAPDTEQRDLMRAPSSWKPTAKAKWAAVDPEIRAEVLRREGDFLKGQSGLIQEAEFARTMKQTLEPYRAMVEADGGSLPAAAASLFRTASILRNGSPQVKLQALQSIARDFQIPLGQPEGEQPQFQPQQQYHDPRVDTLLSQMQAEQRRTMQAEEHEIQSAIEQFTNAADASGAPAHPYFENLESHIAALIPQFKKPGVPYSQVLQEAYDAAVWANPETRALVQQQEVAQLEAKRREESLRVAAEAKKAASVNVPKRGTRPAQPAVSSMDETIRRAGRELGMF